MKRMFLAFAAFAMAATMATADTIPNRRVPAQQQQADIPYMPPAAKGWTGCGFGVGASLVNADADFGSPINVGANGYSGSGGVYCDKAWNRFVAGLFADYGRTWGDIETIAGNHVDTITLGGRAGFLVSDTVLAYALAAWKRTDIGSVDFDGIAVGGGLEFRIPGTPFFGGLEYQKTRYTNVMGSTVDINADEVMLRMRYKFSPDGRR